MINANKTLLGNYQKETDEKNKEIQNVASIEEEAERFQKRSTHWPSIYISGILSFLGYIQIGLYFSSVWPYLQEIDKTSTEKILGVIIAAYSLGELISAPIFGRLSHKIGKIKPLLYVGFSIMLTGNLIYVFAGVMPNGHKYFILSSRFVTGLGMSFCSLLRAYAVSASIPSDRAKSIAHITGGLSLGSFTGPALQLFFTPLGSIGHQIWGDLYFNVYTGPAILACFINFAAYFLIFFGFTEKSIGVVNRNAIKETGIKLPPYSKFAALICYLTTFCSILVVITLGTLNGPLAGAVFGFNYVEIVKYTALAELLRALIGFATYSAYIKWNLGSILNSRKIIIIALGGFLVFHLLTYSWPFLPGHLKTYQNDDLRSMNSTEAVAGCNIDKYSWCHTYIPINYLLYYISYILIIGMGFPILNISLTSLFSKIVGPRPQTIQQGWFQVAGSSGRMIGPIITSALYIEFGPRWSWNAVIALISVTLGCWIFMRRHLIPLEIPKEYAEYHDKNDPDFVNKKVVLKK